MVPMTVPVAALDDLDVSGGAAQVGRGRWGVSPEPSQKNPAACA